ncbi:MAG: hypothetical protein DMG05_28065, partial [Acidobacteria bacterium]
APAWSENWPNVTPPYSQLKSAAGRSSSIKRDEEWRNIRRCNALPLRIADLFTPKLVVIVKRPIYSPGTAEVLPSPNCKRQLRNYLELKNLLGILGG